MIISVHSSFPIQPLLTKRFNGIYSENFIIFKPLCVFKFSVSIYYDQDMSDFLNQLCFIFSIQQRISKQLSMNCKNINI